MPQKQFSSNKNIKTHQFEKLGLYTVRLRHKDKITRCRFFCSVGRWPSPARMPDIELLDKLKIMLEVFGDQQTNRKFDS